MDSTGLKKSGKKHKKHKKQSHDHEHSGVMRVVFPLPTLRPQSRWPGKEATVSPAPPLELKVSIPLAALRKPSPTISRTEGGGEASEHRHHKHKHKKHKKKKHHQTFVSPGQTGSVGHHAFEQAQPTLAAPSQPQGYSLPAVKLSSLPPKQFYDHHAHKHKDKHHHKRQHSERESSTTMHPSQTVPFIPSISHHAPPASPSLLPHAAQHSPLKHPTLHEGKHTHHKKKKKHKHSKSGHHSLPQVAPPHGEQPTSSAPNNETKLEGDHADSHPEGFPPSSKRPKISDPPVLPGKPHPTPTPQQPVQPPQGTKPALSVQPPQGTKPALSVQPPQGTKPALSVQPPQWTKPALSVQPPQGTKPALSVQPPQWTKPKEDPEPSAVQATDSLFPQRNLETHLGSAVAPLQPPPPLSSTTIGPSLLNPPPHRPQPQVKLTRAALKLFLKNVHYQLQRRDPEGIFSEPVTDDIAPGYSSIIPHPMDLGTIGKKIQKNLYPSVNEFKDDFVLMCNNAMTYNGPETVYYAAAKNLLTVGIKIIAKETCLRPDIRYGKLSVPVSRSETASPAPLSDFILPPATNFQLDYTSPFICKIDLALLRPHPQPANGSLCSSPVPLTDQNNLLAVDVGDASGEISDQSHLTKVIVGVEEDGEGVGMLETPEEILMEVQEAAEAAKENLDVNFPGGVTTCFLNRGPEGKTMLNILNPHVNEVDIHKPVDLTVLSERVRAGNNAATVLKTELPMFKATPVSYLMYGPFGSFAPVYDSTFATLTKMDSDLLLSTYGSDLGVSYSHSLQQFVKGTGSFVNQMADAVLNGLTGGRHTDFMEKFRVFEEKERKVKESLRMEVQTTPGNKNPPETRNDSATPNGGDQASNILEDRASNVLEDRASNVLEDQASNVLEDRASNVLEDRASNVLEDRASNVLEDQASNVLEDQASNVLEDQASSVTSSEGSREQTPLGVEEGVRSEGGGSEGGGSEGGGSEGGGSEVTAPDESEGSGDMEVLEASHKALPSDASPSTLSQTLPPGDIDRQLQHTSELISELQQHQLERLSQPPTHKLEGHWTLPPPSQEESNTASQLTQELTALTSQVPPVDVVSVPSLHKAMGISLHQTEGQLSLQPIAEQQPFLQPPTESQPSPQALTVDQSTANENRNVAPTRNEHAFPLTVNHSQQSM